MKEIVLLVWVFNVNFAGLIILPKMPDCKVYFDSFINISILVEAILYIVAF